MKEVLYIQRFADGYLANCINDKEVKEQVDLVEIRGSVVAPVDEHPGYYLFFGMMKSPNIYTKHPLLYLCEGECRTHGALIEAVFNDAARMKAGTVYAYRGADKIGFFRQMWNERIRQNLPLRIMPAASTGDIDYGMGIIRDWTREDAILRPRITPTTLVRQLTEEMREGDIDTSDNRWYSFHALRYLVAGFIKDPPMAIRAPGRLLADRFDDISIPAIQFGRSGSRLGAWT